MAINELNHGPATKINITLKMLELLARCAETEISEHGGTGNLDPQEETELKSFIEMVGSTVSYERSKPGMSNTHGFCL